jgi:hypothetical protein
MEEADQSGHGFGGVGCHEDSERATAMAGGWHSGFGRWARGENDRESECGCASARKRQPGQLGIREMSRTVDGGC